MFQKAIVPTGGGGETSESVYEVAINQTKTISVLKDTDDWYVFANRNTTVGSIYITHNGTRTQYSFYSTLTKNGYAYADWGFWNNLPSDNPKLYAGDTVEIISTSTDYAIAVLICNQ